MVITGKQKKSHSLLDKKSTRKNSPQKITTHALVSTSFVDMSADALSYLLFIIALVLSLVLDSFVFSKKNAETTLKQAGLQYLFWVVVALVYGIYLWKEYDSHKSILYFTAYLMEMSLSIDNIFVFVLIFSSLQISKANIGRVLMIGVLLAIVLRILFILLGIALVTKFHMILYGFGLLLIYTGIKLFFEKKEEHTDIKEGRIYKFFKKYLRYTDVEPEGKFRLELNGQVYFTRLFLTVLLIGVTDIVFAIDSIPAVFAITTDNIVVFSSNIFAVLGLRALFFILQKMADEFDFLQQGIAVVLIFIGAKMFLELVHVEIPHWISLVFIILCIGASILYSHYHRKYKHNELP